MWEETSFSAKFCSACEPELDIIVQSNTDEGVCEALVLVAAWSHWEDSIIGTY